MSVVKDIRSYFSQRSTAQMCCASAIVLQLTYVHVILDGTRRIKIEFANYLKIVGKECFRCVLFHVYIPSSSVVSAKSRDLVYRNGRFNENSVRI